LVRAIVAFIFVGVVLGIPAYVSFQNCHIPFPVGTKVRLKAYPESRWVVADTICNAAQVWAPGATSGWFPVALLEPAH
jgi:hypothetical protein